MHSKTDFPKYKKFPQQAGCPFFLLKIVLNSHPKFWTQWVKKGQLQMAEATDNW